MAVNIREKVRSVFAEVCKVDIEHLDDEVRVREELGIDSILGLQLLARCEVILGIEVDEAACAELETVGQFLDYFESASGS